MTNTDARTIIAAATRSISFEGLEGRQLMSGVGFAHNTLTINGTTKSDDIRVSLSSDKKTITAQLNNEKAQSFKASNVYTISISTDEGNNKVVIDSRITANATVKTCDGNDSVQTGAGNDRITTGGGNDRVDAGAGNDYIETAGGSDRIDMGAGNDKAVAGADNDTIISGAGKDAILGQDGSDTISAKKTDSVNAGQGKNTITFDGAATPVATPAAKPTTPAKPSTTPTPTPAPTPVPTPVPSPTPTTSSSPKIKMNVLQTSIPAGQAFHAEATQTVIPGFQAEDATFSWNFGDAGSKYNTMPGFNAAHVYETAGTYTATLTVTSPTGQTSSQSFQVKVNPVNLDTIYVDASGSDNNNGQSQSSAVKTLAKALSLAGSNTQVLLQRGDTFQMTSGVNVTGNNVTISSYGSAASNPVLLFTGARSGNPSLIGVSKAATNVTIENLTFNSIYAADGNSVGMVHAISNGGTAVTIRDNQFLNVGYGVNANMQPTGMLVMDNVAPLATGLRSYFVWAEGNDIVIVGNKVANSTREHVVRLGGANRVSIYANDLTNLDRTSNGDSADVAKGALVIQKGTFAYIANNNLHGPVGVGPLGDVDGLYNTGARFQHAAFDGNTFFGKTLDVHHGAENVTIRNNTSYVDNAEAYKVEAYSKAYGRGVYDVTIDRNVAINTGVAGNFLNVEGPADGITLTNNVYAAANLKAGSGRTAAVYVNDSSLASFRRIDNNVWPSVARGSNYARGGIMVVGTSYASNDHKTPTEWNNFAQVGNDEFRDVSLDNVASGAMKITSSVLKSVVKLAA